MSNVPIIDLIFQRHVRQVHRLGVRALAELLSEIDADPQHEVHGRVARYAALDPHALQHVGGDGFPAQPLMLVPTIRDRVITGVADHREIMQASLSDSGDAV